MYSDFAPYVQRPNTVQAAINESNVPEDVVFKEVVYTVPAGWVIVVLEDDHVAMVPRASFDAMYTAQVVPVSLDGFLNTVSDLRHTDAMAALSLDALAQRVAALEAAVAAPGEPTAP